MQLGQCQQMVLINRTFVTRTDQGKIVRKGYSKLLPNQFHKHFHNMVCAYPLNIRLQHNANNYRIQDLLGFTLRFSLLKSTAELLETENDCIYERTCSLIYHIILLALYLSFLFCVPLSFVCLRVWKGAGGGGGSPQHFSVSFRQPRNPINKKY
jgi:hypothetical protein